jgi:prepilin-type N-terminal cleavage/methylation domain-containing protein
VRQPNRAFTLVELLVVIGIIALLISILLPALNKARAKAMETACLSNMRQISMGMLAYTQDNRGSLPQLSYPSDLALVKPDGNAANGGERYNAAYGSGWIIRLIPYMSLSPSANREKRDVMFCPQDDRGNVSAWGTNYAWQSTYRAIEVFGWKQGGTWEPVKINKVPATANLECYVYDDRPMPLLIEQHTSAAPNGMIRAPWSFGYPGVLGSSPHQKGKARSILFHDWHVEMDYIAWDDVTKTSKRPAGSYVRFWFPGAF